LIGLVGMRHSYGIVDQRELLLYKPQLFRKTDDILVFPSKEFEKWHSQIIEYLDGIYQINAKNMENGRLVDVDDLDLTLGLLFNINQELENIFNQDNKMDFSYEYVSIMDEKYKKCRSNYYGRYRHKIDRRVTKITPQIRYMHLLEIVNYAQRLWSEENRESKLRTMEK